MSAQSKAKAAQGYVAKAIPATCANCSSFTKDVVERKSTWDHRIYIVESNLRCAIGGFAVKKMGTCDLFTGVAE